MSFPRLGTIMPVSPPVNGCFRALSLIGSQRILVSPLSDGEVESCDSV